MSQTETLTRKDVQRAAWYWIFFHHCAQNYERMMGVAFGSTLSKSLEKIYKNDKDGLADALSRNVTFFNTEPHLGSVIPGIALALEEKHAQSPETVDAELIQSTKNSLMGPLAGIGDSLLIGTINPILLSIGIGMSSQGSSIGVIFFIISWLAVTLSIKYFFFMKGYDLGLDAVKMLADQRLKYIVTTALTIIGLIVIGGVAATTVKASVALFFTSGEMTISIQEILDKIMPSILPLIVTLISYFLVSKKNWSTNKLLCAILIFSAVMVILKVM